MRSVGEDWWEIGRGSPLSVSPLGTVWYPFSLGLCLLWQDAGGRGRLSRDDRLVPRPIEQEG